MRGKDEIDHVQRDEAGQRARFRDGADNGDRFALPSRSVDHFSCVRWAEIEEIERALLKKYGPLKRLGYANDVAVFRLHEPQGQLAFLKIHCDSVRGEREATLLNTPLPVVKPTLIIREKLINGCVLLGLNDVRAGRGHSIRSPRKADLLECARTVGHVHECFVDTCAGPEDFVRVLRERIERTALDAKVVRGFEQMVICPDAFCHQDLHPSNWIVAAGDRVARARRERTARREGKRSVVGFLDWAAAGYAEPESDLAQIALAGGGRIADIEVLCCAWEAQHLYRRADRTRVLLYLILEIAEQMARAAKQKQEMLKKQYRRLVDALSSFPALHGSKRKQHLFSFRSVDRCTKPSERWIEVSLENVAPLVSALERKNTTQEACVKKVWLFGRHACNDVCRVAFSTVATAFLGVSDHGALGAARGEDGRKTVVVKIFNKPVKTDLFELEANLAKRLSGKRATVCRPLKLACGVRWFKVKDRLAAVYLDCGDTLLDNTWASMCRLAAAQAELHVILDHEPCAEGNREPETRATLADIDRAVKCGTTFLEKADEKEALLQVAEWMKKQIRNMQSARLPRSLVHGAIHRDHVLVHETGENRCLALFDFEKARWSVRIEDVAKTAYYVGYRSNDEQLSPQRMVGYLAAYHQNAPFESEEIDYLCVIILRNFFQDLDTLPKEGYPPHFMQKHIYALLNYHWNIESLQYTLEKRLNKASLGSENDTKRSK
jgi:Ser/Thr protein kinase RdoA (MazF antagonist)